MKIFFALFFATAYTVAAQTPQVPHKMQFAGMTLTIRDDARREIQKDVNALTQSPRHHLIKVERAKTYFPIIEKVFEEERVPDDFKYLVLQESALIADAVSVSNAVGFWQFKDFTALEMGLRVDKEIDERLNIVSSTRAAARYIKKNNFYFNNWIYALQAYQMGAGGVLKSVRETQSGLKHMEITSATYWYIKKYLAHKIAFEEAVKGVGQIQVLSYENRSKQLLTDIAKAVSIDENELKLYNKWAKTGAIPDDRMYTVMIPVGDAKDIKLPATAIVTSSGKVSETVKHSSAASSATEGRTKINGIAAIKAHSGENPTRLASRAGIDLTDFLKWNDISISDPIVAEQYYLLGKKRGRASASYHKVSSGENLWMISQQYGVQVKRLKRYNRISSDKELTPGMTLWLSSSKPKNSNAEIVSTEVIQVDKTKSFSWTVNPDQAEATAAGQLVVVDTPVVNEPLHAPERTDSLENIQVKSVATTTQDTVEQQNVEPIMRDDKKEHVVRAGETVYGIATQYKLSVMDIVTWNNLNLQDGIRPGQVIKLSESQPIAVEQKASNGLREIEHVVKSSDTLYSVARRYNVTIKELMEWNDKQDFTLSVGDKLKIKSK